MAEDTNGYKIFEASGGITSFNASNINLVTDNWTDVGGWWYDWKVYQSGNAIYLSYNAVPEPSTYVMISLLLIPIAYKVWHRKRRKKREDDKSLENTNLYEL